MHELHKNDGIRNWKIYDPDVCDFLRCAERRDLKPSNAHDEQPTFAQSTRRPLCLRSYSCPSVASHVAAAWESCGVQNQSLILYWILRIELQPGCLLYVRKCGNGSLFPFCQSWASTWSYIIYVGQSIAKLILHHCSSRFRIQSSCPVWTHWTLLYGGCIIFEFCHHKKLWG